jgi:hypothetical protein
VFGFLSLLFFRDFSHDCFVAFAFTFVVVALCCAPLLGKVIPILVVDWIVGAELSMVVKPSDGLQKPVSLTLLVESD